MSGSTSNELPEGWDDLVNNSADIDPFCSGSDWILSTRQVYASSAELCSRGGTAHGAAVALMSGRSAGGEALLWGLDPLWGFASPIVGPDLDAGAALLADLLDAETRWHAVVLTGTVEGSARETALLNRLAGRRAARGQAITRRIVRLDQGGMDGFLARRSAKFRRNLRRADRAAQEARLAVEFVRSGGASVVDRCQAVDRASWKAQSEVGLNDDDFARFYRVLAGRLDGHGALRAGFVRDGTTDVAYILGAVRGDTYRGFQLGYAETHAHLSLGNVLQYHQLLALQDEAVDRYDLGMDMAYKAAWSDETLTTYSLIILR